MAINNKYDFLALIECVNSNPNGDPDNGNSPRQDVMTGHGIISDVCVKRKIRNYIELVKEGEPGYDIIIKTDRSINEKIDEVAVSHKDIKDKAEKERLAKEDVCKRYFDVRTFGAVLSTGDNPIGVIRGPIQIGISRSVDPIEIEEMTITRQAKTTEKRQEASGNSEIGRKSFVPYGLYVIKGHISAAQTNKTGLSEDDLELFWNAIIHMFDDDASAARGEMNVRGLYIFKHSNMYGSAPSWELFDKIKIEKITAGPARCFADYRIDIDDKMPDGIELICRSLYGGA